MDMKLVSFLGIVLLHVCRSYDTNASVVGQPDDIMKDAFKYWNQFRDGSNGLWCDSIGLSADSAHCKNGTGFYSSAGVGMGLVTDCIQAELGFISKADAQQRVLQTLDSILNVWPRESAHGFFVHFYDGIKPLSEYSTIDTAILTAGALFASKYFGGGITLKAEQLFALTDWGQAISSATDPGMYTTVDPASGKMGGNLKPFNEYYIVAFMAKRQKTAKASQYFETFFGTNGKPQGAQGFPKVFNYWGYELLSDHDGAVSSFIPQFCYYLTKGYQNNPYHMAVFHNWFLADVKFWDLALRSDAQVWGKPVKGYVFGSGAGPDPTGYVADSIDNDRALTFSVPIMAGFIPVTKDGGQYIASQIRHLYDNGICAYSVEGIGKVLWRCSVKNSQWKAQTVDSIDYSSMVLGYASLFLPRDFYMNYASDAENDQVQIV